MKKINIIKRTATYLLFNVDGTASGIISTKFLRKKDSDDCLFLSVPSEYEITCRVKEYQQGKGYVVKKEFVITAEKLRPIVLAFNKELLKDNLPF